MLFQEINEKKTIANVKKVLRQYPRIREIACDMPSKQVEKLAIRRVDASRELEEIEQAVSRLFNSKYRFILFNKYLATEPMLNYEIQEKLWIEKTKFQEYLNSACLAFAEQYHNGSLVVLK